MFSVHTTLEEFKNATITGHFGFVFEENSTMEITWIVTPSVSKSSVFKMFSVCPKTKTSVFKGFRFEEHFRKAPFSKRIIVETGLTVELKLRF